MNEQTKKNIFIVAIILIFLILLYLLLSYVFKEDPEEYEEYLKNYGVNEYINTYVSDEDMAKIYLNDYTYNMYTDVDAAYNLLDEEYRNKKFGNLENYKNYVNSLEYSSYVLTKYYVDKAGNNVTFGVYDQNGNLFVFKTNGVMQYKVYLDDYTVEI